MTLEATEIDEQVWKVNVVLAYPGEGPAFESYRQGLFNNRLWLQKADGSRFEHNGGFSNTVVRRRQARLRIPLRRRPRQARRLRARLRDPEQGPDDPAGVRVQGRAAAVKREAAMATDVRVRLDTADNLICVPGELGRIPVAHPGDRRPDTFASAFDGERVELMSPGQEHEDYKVLFERLVGRSRPALKVPCKGMGSARWLRPEAERGLEADASFYLTTDKIAIARRRPKKPADYPIPDLSVEIDLRPSQIDRAGIYEDLGVREVWRFDGETVRIDRLGPDGHHADAPESGWLGIRPEEIARLLTLDAEDDNDFSNQVVASARRRPGSSAGRG